MELTVAELQSLENARQRYCYSCAKTHPFIPSKEGGRGEFCLIAIRIETLEVIAR